MDNENQTLRELIRARKQARPNKQNLDSSDTDSYENTSKFSNKNFANSNNTAEFDNENLANSDNTAEIGNSTNGNSTAKFNNKNLANSDSQVKFGNENFKNSDSQMKFGNENFKNSDSQVKFDNQNTANPNNQNPKIPDNQNPHLNLRDYDKDLLILRDYSGFGLAMNYLLTITYWLFSTAYILGKMDDFEQGLLSLGEVAHIAIIFAFITLILFVLDFFIISTSKPKYAYFYNSKVVYCNHKNKINLIRYFEVYGDKIVLKYSINNQNDDDFSHIEMQEGKMKFCSFMQMITTEHFGWVFFGVFVLINLLGRDNFLNFCIGIFAIIFMLFVTEILESLVFIGIYKQSNKSLKNFWKYVRKFQIDIEWYSIERWKPSVAISMFYFNQKDHDELKKYLDIVFHKDLDNSNKFFIRSKI